MLNEEIRQILISSKKIGWVLEPDAKKILELAGLHVPKFLCTVTEKKAIAFANKIGYPVVVKIVSPEILHKSDVNGVITGIDNENELKDAFNKFKEFRKFSGVLVEEMVSGLELIIGLKVDYQFGPVILLGIGGTGVEIYQDTVFRMAPINEKDVISMIKHLKAKILIEGFRGQVHVNKDLLTRELLKFSEFAMEFSDDIESVDLNPVMCSPTGCLVADARIILR